MQKPVKLSLCQRENNSILNPKDWAPNNKYSFSLIEANLIKQSKLKEKSAQFSKSKSKGFEKTGDNWKAASEDFRSAIKGIKVNENQ